MTKFALYAIYITAATITFYLWGWGALIAVMIGWSAGCLASWQDGWNAGWEYAFDQPAPEKRKRLD